MSVSIDFYLEVRHDGQWSLLRWKQPTELMTYHRTKAKHQWETQAMIFYCDYCFIDDFIENYSHEQDGLPDDVTPELKRILSRNKNGYGTGYFDVSRIWEYLTEKREKMLESLIQSRDYQMVYKLNKIEAKICGKKDSSPIDLKNEYYKSAGLRDLYASYEDHTWAVKALASAITNFTDAFYIHVKSPDMRVIFSIS